MTLLEKLNECRICKSNDIQIILKLKDTPLEDQFLQKKKYQPLYPLEVAMCQNCSYVFLPHVINPDTSYDDYIYESSVTVGLEDHYKTYAQEIIKSYKIKKNSLALDLGSNDGSMLKAFLKEDMKVLGVEPAKKISDFANEIKLRTINNFFSEELARKIIKEEGQASIITANYMFANIHNLKDFLSGVKLLLDNDGIFIIQTGYHPYQFSKNMFDYIYHEHFSYFTLKTLSYLLNDFELEIVDAKILKPKGGSIRVFVKNKSIKNLQSDRLKNLIYEEKKHKYNSHHIFTILNENISKERDKLITQLEVLKKDNVAIAGIGASHSTTTLIFHFQIYRYIDFLIDDNPKKHNTFSPGLHIKVFKKKYLTNKKIRHIIILAWQHQDTIITKYRSFLNREGTIFVPLPKFKIIKKHKL